MTHILNHIFPYIRRHSKSMSKKYDEIFLMCDNTQLKGLHGIYVRRSEKVTVVGKKVLLNFFLVITTMK
eukprot:UN25763